MLDQLRELEGAALDELHSVRTTEALEAWRVAYLGRKGALTSLLRSVGRLPAEQRPAAGQEANRVKLVLEQAYDEKAEALKREEMSRQLAEGHIDVTLPGRAVELGYLHVSTQTLREIYAIFAEMGFQVLETPEVETDINNFQLLNIPPYHPARDMWSTFHTTREGVLLRTHTSPGQIRAMHMYCPQPVRVILPGKCYRYEQVTARSESMFYQVEGLAIGHNITMGDLKGVLTHFARQMFGADRKVRFRCSYFPFTEPSAEVDMDCIICGGQGCRVCKHTGWVEILGSGMVHPQVLANGGYDPAIYTGFAFGMGPERIAMLKYGIEDIRYIFANDLRFLQQFV
ncbi:MAG: phenylalanyl-tRNA synthetase subunit alpha [Anaerolineae bacterium SM23_84]|nr:MAG: phenylalanyl-tRNA synthetase subunit alpha [Anaerolineae bacterium SM23_84]